MKERTPLQIVEESQEALVAGDVDRYLSLLATDIEADDPAGSVRGHDGVREHLAAMFSRARSISFLERKLFPSGRKVAMKFTLRIETTTGREGVFEGVDVFELDETHAIHKITSFYDGAALARLLGGD